MKKTIVILSAVCLLLGFSSCNKNVNPGSDETGQGALTVEFDLNDQTKAPTASTAVPTTDWNNNIKNLMILFVDPTDNSKVVDARELALSAATGIAEETRTIMNVKANSNYTVYLVANYDPAINLQKIGAANGSDWNVNTIKGQKISDALLFLSSSSAFTTDKDNSTESSAKGHNEATDVFIAKQTGVAVVADATTIHPTKFTLKRAISMFRVRIKVGTYNTNITADANSAIRIRRAATNINLDGSVFPATPSGDNVVYKKGFNSGVATGYTNGGTILGGDGQKWWQDVKIFPGGDGTVGLTDGLGSKKFDLVVTATAPMGYVPLGASTGLGAASKVHWSGIVQGTVLANNIIEVNVTLESAGSTTVPPVGSTGNLTIKADIATWGTIASADVIM